MKDCLIGCHFVKACPTQEQGASTFKMHRNTCRRRCWIAVVLCGARMHEGDEIMIVSIRFMHACSSMTCGRCHFIARMLVITSARSCGLFIDRHARAVRRTT